MIHKTCIDCKKDFEEYTDTEICWTCDGEGEVEKEMPWEDEPSIYTCSTCKGSGEVIVKKNRCKSCQIDLEERVENRED